DRRNRGRATELERAHEIVERQAGVDDVLDDEHVTAADVEVEILEHAALLVPSHACASVAGELDEVERVEDGNGPREVRDEDEARLERTNEDRPAAGGGGFGFP